MSIHISAKPGEIAPVVLMPGDPLRAKYIADHFLEDVSLVNRTRNAYYYTGAYQNKPVSVGASGMGCPSIGIYSYELYKEYNVECIIRIGTCGSYSPELGLYEVINTDVACSESTYAKFAFGIEGSSIPHQGKAFELINQTAAEKGIAIQAGPIHSSDIFYRADPGLPAIVKDCGCIAVEMEAFALFANAKYLGKTAATLLTVSDVIPTKQSISADQRERSLERMITLALEAAIRY